MERFEEYWRQGPPDRQLRADPAKKPMLMQIVRDAMGRPVEISRSAQTGARWALRLGAGGSRRARGLRRGELSDDRRADKNKFTPIAARASTTGCSDSTATARQFRPRRSQRAAAG